MQPLLGPAERAFLAGARTATLATRGTSGRVRLVPICFVLGADGPDGRPRLYSPLDDKPKSSDDPHDLGRVRDLLVLPEATLLVDRWSEDWSELGWLRLEAAGEILEPEPHEREEHAAAVVALREKYQQYAGHRIDARPIIRFTVQRVIGWGAIESTGTGTPTTAGREAAPGPDSPPGSAPGGPSEAAGQRSR